MEPFNRLIIPFSFSKVDTEGWHGLEIVGDWSVIGPLGEFSGFNGRNSRRTETGWKGSHVSTGCRTGSGSGGGCRSRRRGPWY